MSSAQFQNGLANADRDAYGHRGGPGHLLAVQIGAVGVVEPSSQQINIGTNVSATITDVFVMPGAKVSRGDKLFALDARIAQATLDLRRRDLATAQARLAQARARVPGLQAEVEVANDGRGCPIGL